MDAKEAMNILSNVRDYYLQFLNKIGDDEKFLRMTWTQEALACDTGIKALEKQTPRKPKSMKSILDFSGRYYTTKGDCPNCGAEGLYRSSLYCDKCGQRLDWGEG